MTADASLDDVRAYWTAHLGFDPDRANGVLVARPEGTLSRYAGVYVFRHGYSCIVSPPPAWRPILREALAGRTPDEAFDVAALTAALGDAAGLVVGPAFIGCADAEDFRPAPPPRNDLRTRLLEPRDRPALEALAAACPPIEWEHSAIEYDRAPIFGAFEGDVLVAAASYEAWGDRLRAVGFITHPSRRHRGYGLAVGSAATAHGIAGGYVMIWQTLESNAPSMAVAKRLGYQPYARTIAIRLRSE
jgi:RimJ/RimL family protein N-acetyltransferase